MGIIEDCWVGSPSGAKPVRNPLDGSTLSWTGEIIFERVLPKPPNGKLWCGDELVRARAGSKRAPYVHPLHWWLMSTTARLKASDQWKVKYKEISQAQNRRTIPRDVLDEMPKASIIKDYNPNPAGQSTMVLVNDLTETSNSASAIDNFGKRFASQRITDDNAEDPAPDLVNESDSECNGYGYTVDDDN
jgi:hypothetical protein